MSEHKPSRKPAALHRLAEHLELLGVGHRRSAAHNGNGAVVDQDIAGGVAAQRDDVVEAVTDRGERFRRKKASNGHCCLHYRLRPGRGRASASSLVKDELG